MKATAVSGFLAPVRDVDGNFLITPAYMESLQIFPRQTLEALILVVETEFGDKVDRTGVDWAAQMPVLEVMCIVGLHAQVLDLVGDLDDEIQFDEEGHVLLLSSEDDGPWCLEDFKAELAAGLAA